MRAMCLAPIYANDAPNSIPALSVMMTACGGLKDCGAKKSPTLPILAQPVTPGWSTGARRKTVSGGVGLISTSADVGGMPSASIWFLLGLGRLPEVRYRSCDIITPRLWRVLGIFTDDTPAIVRTVTWDVTAWNRAAAAVFSDYGRLAPTERNVLRLMFCEPRMRAVQGYWQHAARLVVASFRRDATRADADAEVERLVTELSQASPEFAAMWRDEIGRTSVKSEISLPSV